MNAKEIGTKLVELCKAGKDIDCINAYYAPDVVSVEAAAPPAGGERTMSGIDAIRGKNKWWSDNHEIHSAEVNGPYPHGDDRFAVRFVYDLTFKPTGQKLKLDEIGIFSVANGKITREEFFYPTF